MVPLALGAAVSPLVLLGAIAVMTGPAPLRHGLAYAVGVAVPLLAVTALALILGRAFELPQASSPVKGAIDIVLAALLFALGIRAWLRPQAVARSKQRPDDRGLGGTVATGAGLMTSNLTTFALYVPALKLIEASGVGVPEEVAALAIVLAITMAPVLVPLAIVAVAPGASERLLTGAGEWFAGHRRTLAIGLCGGFGIYLLVHGLARLL